MHIGPRSCDTVRLGWFGHERGRLFYDKNKRAERFFQACGTPDDDKEKVALPLPSSSVVHRVIPGGLLLSIARFRLTRQAKMSHRVQEQ